MSQYLKKPKFVDPRNDDAYYEFMDLRGEIDHDDVTFTINVAPESLDRNFQKNVDKVHKSIDGEIKSLKFLKKIIKYFECPEMKIEGDFYWGEGDLNMRITIPLSHPKLPKP